MAGIPRRLNGLLAGVFPEKRIFIQSENSTRYVRFSPLTQMALSTGLMAFIGWTAVSTTTMAINFIAADARGSQAQAVREAYETRLGELAAERDTRAAEARSAQARFETAMDQISRQQTEIIGAIEHTRELDIALDLTRNQLRETVADRDRAIFANARLRAEANAKEEAISGASGEDLDETLRTVSEALADTSGERDAADAERAKLAAQVAELRLRAEVTEQREKEMMGEIEQAVALSFGPMRKVFANANIDVDGLINKIRGDYSGEGGPETPAVVSTRNYDDGISNQFDSVMVDIDRMNLMRIAAGKVPLAIPVRDTFRFTSGFGIRRDPKGAGRRMHAGVDFAAPKGTPIYATADGVVVAAERESGYGNVVRIRHELGFETVYAHQSRIRVQVGQKVSRGERIGDMGSTGRSTGVHLHYEVHLNGRPVNPMTYLEAARDVF